MDWTEEKLNALPVRNGFRMRGESMTRLEVFSDAAFAFALTTLVVSVGSIPGDYEQLMVALKKVPGFAMSFAQIAVFWIAHRSWSRRYGLEDAWTTALTLFMILTILVYVFPLRLIFSTFLAWASVGWLPAEFEAKSAEEVTGLFAIYGLGFSILTGVLTGLFYRSLKSRDRLSMNDLEALKTKEGIAIWLLQSSVGLASTLWALLLPTAVAVYAGFWYFLLPAATPLASLRFKRERKIKQVEATPCESDSHD